MITKIIKLLNVLCLLGCAGWYFKHPDWEPVITGIGLFGTLLSLEFTETKSIINNPDIKLYNKLIGLIPSSTLIEYLKVWDFGGPFDSEYLDPLRDFNHYWNNAEHEFMNSKLEAKKKELLTVTDEFLACIGHNTWPLHKGYQSIPAEWQEDQPARWEKAQTELNRLSNKIVTVHQEFVRMAKKILHV
jgi:hypothetical protein